MKDLLVVVADQDAEFLLKTLLNRIQGIERLLPFTFDIVRHPQRDAGCATQLIDFVRSNIRDYKYLLVLFDYEGSGLETETCDSIESKIKESLNRNGWENKNACIVFKPELETWLWVNNTHLNAVTDWEDNQDIYKWIRERGFDFSNQTQKPVRPKEAFLTVLRKQSIPRSASLFSDLAKRASYRNCMDPSFNNFLRVIKEWFGKE
jgi:hypothetical protein